MLSFDEQTILQLITKSRKKDEIIQALEKATISSEYDKETQKIIEVILLKVKAMQPEEFERPEYSYAWQLLYA